MKRIRSVFGFTLSLCILFQQTTLSLAQNQKDLNIYVAASMSGSNAFEGVHLRKTAERYIDAKNKNGGLLGRRLRLIVQDDSGDIETAGKNARTAIADPNHLVTLGSPYSRIALPVSSLYAKNNKLYFTSFATHPDITSYSGTVFQSAYNDEFQGAVLAEFVTKHLQTRKVLIVTLRSDPFSESLSNEFISHIPKTNEVTVKQFNYLSDTLRTDLLLGEIDYMMPDVIFLPLLRDKAAEIMKVLTHANFNNFRILGSDGWGVQAEIKTLIQKTLPNNLATECFYTFFWDPSLNTPFSKYAVNWYHSNFNSDPYVISAFAIEELEFIFRAVEAARTTDQLILAKTLRDREWSGLTGNMRFNATSTSRPVVILKMSQKALAVNAVISPQHRIKERE